MRIAFLNIYQNKVYRGAETFVYELSKRLSRNHKVDIISNVSYWILLKGKYDVIIPTNGRFQAFAVRIIAWLTGAKVIISGQSGMGLDDRLNLYSFPNVFAALSSSALTWAKKINPFVKSVYISNGVDVEKFKPEKAPHKIKTVLAVGAFTEQKRLDLAIKAVGKLDGVKLLIAGGGGNLRDKIYDLGIKELGKNRFQVLSVPFEKMPEVYHLADVVTLPSRSSESFGNVLVEALASGLPVVATDDPIRREIVGTAGILVDPTDIGAYSKSLEMALTKDWGDLPRKQAMRFSWDLVAQKYETLLKTLV